MKIKQCNRNPLFLADFAYDGEFSDGNHFVCESLKVMSLSLLIRCCKRIKMIKKEKLK